MKKLILFFLCLSSVMAEAADFKKFCFDMLGNIPFNFAGKAKASFSPGTFVRLFPLVELKPHPDDTTALLGHGYFAMGIIGITLPSFGTIRIRIIPYSQHPMTEVDAIIKLSEKFVREEVNGSYRVEVSGSTGIIYVNLETKYGQAANDAFLERLSELAQQNDRQPKM